MDYYIVYVKVNGKDYVNNVYQNSQNANAVANRINDELDAEGMYVAGITCAYVQPGNFSDRKEI